MPRASPSCPNLPPGPLTSILISHCKHHFPTERPNAHRCVTGRPRKLCLPYVLDRIIHVLKSGVPWRMLPVEGASWQSVYHYFRLFSKKKLFDKAFHDCHKWYAKVSGKNHRTTIDASFVKNQYGRDCVGKNHADRGRRATKVSLLNEPMRPEKLKKKRVVKK
mmetsp:Transcript_101/g.478  ORF Transcript_101/g.478 Transcript_101/m.478 type:complete len:163 (-) Transcript_101:751-1239(-)|eukprot:scaffold77_cov236-Pinguiococcus_pyrenoidosus.AAC.2